MVNPSDFDAAAANYDDVVQRAIGASGESVQFFADLKAQLMARALVDHPPACILDFGCGVGNTTRALGGWFPSAQIFGFDESAGSVEAARRRTTRGTTISFECANDGRLPWPSGFIDAAFASCVFHHIDPSQRLHWARELRRVLRPGGVLFLFEHNPYNPLTVQVVRRVPFDAGVVLLRPRDTVQLLRRAGFASSRPWFYFFFPAFLHGLRWMEPALRRVPFGAQYFVVGTS